MAKVAKSLNDKIPLLAEMAMKEAKPRWELFLKYAKVELTPPTPSEIPAIAQGLSKLMGGFFKGRWTQVTTKEAWLNTMITVEVACWFFVGECIGKRHIVGYKV